MKYFLFFFIPILCFQTLSGQNDSRLEEILGEYAEGESDEYSQVIEELVGIFENPIHFDLVNREILQTLPFLSDVQISSFLAYKDTIQEPVWEDIFVLISASLKQREILPLIIQLKNPRYDYSSYKSPVHINVISSIWGNVEKSAGYRNLEEDAGFQGPPYGVRTRAQANNRDFDIKVIAESDPGEEDFREPDYISVGIVVHPGRQPFRLYFGDYNFTAGLGLGFATKPVFKSWKADPQLQIRQRTAISLHGGSDENRFLRGGAAQYRGRRLSGSFFISARDIDATIKSVENDLSYVSGIYSSGLHRSSLEQQKNNAVFEEVQGLEMDYTGDSFEAGTLFAQISLSEKFKNPNDNSAFLNEVSRYSIWARGLVGKGMLMGELAFSSSGASALSLAYSGFYNSGFSYLVSYERIDPFYFSHRTLVSSALIKSEGDQEGRINILFQPRKKWGIQADLAIKGINDPVFGSLDADYKIRSRFFYDMDMLRGELIFQNSPGKLMSSFKIKAKDRYRDKNKAFYWQGEMGVSSSDLSGILRRPGTYLSARIKYKGLSERIKLQTGISLFTGNSDSGVFYTYEPDVYYGMSLPALSGAGARVFVLVTYEFLKNLRIEMKISRLDYDDRREIGTGLDRIPFDHRTSVKLQIMYRGEV